MKDNEFWFGLVVLLAFLLFGPAFIDGIFGTHIVENLIHQWGAGQ
jgi:hypothetical protein